MTHVVRDVMSHNGETILYRGPKNECMAYAMGYVPDGTFHREFEFAESMPMVYRVSNVGSGTRHVCIQEDQPFFS